MITDKKHSPDHDFDYEDDTERELDLAPSPAPGAHTSLAALSTALSKVDTATVLGGSGLPLMQFRREGDGTWTHGSKRTRAEAGSTWAANPLSFRWGWVS